MQTKSLKFTVVHAYGTWESPQTEWGKWYIENREDFFFCFHNYELLHPMYEAPTSLSQGICLCEDHYHDLRWGSGLTEVEKKNA